MFSLPNTGDYVDHDTLAKHVYGEPGCLKYGCRVYHGGQCAVVACRDTPPHATLSALPPARHVLTHLENEGISYSKTRDGAYVVLQMNGAPSTSGRL